MRSVNELTPWGVAAFKEHTKAEEPGKETKKQQPER